MRRANGTGSIRQRKDGVWEGRYFVVGGDRYSVFGRTREEAEDKLDTALAWSGGVSSLTKGVHPAYLPRQLPDGKWLYIFHSRVTGRRMERTFDTRKEATAFRRLVESGADVSSHPKRRGMSLRLRFRVLERCKFRCSYCGATADEAKLVVDHILPIIAGGTHDEANLTAACVDCNAGKATRVLDA